VSRHPLDRFWLRALYLQAITLISREEYELRMGGWISPDQVAAAREDGAKPSQVVDHLKKEFAHE